MTGQGTWRENSCKRGGNVNQFASIWLLSKTPCPSEMSHSSQHLSTRNCSMDHHIIYCSRYHQQGPKCQWRTPFSAPFASLIIMSPGKALFCTLIRDWCYSTCAVKSTNAPDSPQLGFRKMNTADVQCPNVEGLPKNSAVGKQLEQ